MEKKISDDQPSSSCSVSAGGDSSRPSLKIRIPEMRKQLKSTWDKQEEEEAVKELNVKSEPKEELIQVHHQPKLQQLVGCSSSSSSSSFESKLEATKRKFHDSYQQIANAKRQRRIQVIEPWNLPPQSARGGKGTSKLAGAAADGGSGGAKSRILNVTRSKKKNKKNSNNLFSASRSKPLLKPSYICC